VRQRKVPVWRTRALWHAARHSPGDQLSVRLRHRLGMAAGSTAAPAPSLHPSAALQSGGNECVFAHPLPDQQEFKEKQDKAELRGQLLWLHLVLHRASSFCQAGSWQEATMRG